MKNRGSIVLLFVLMLAAPAHADEFKALPGLWKTTYQDQAKGSTQRIVWHCVYEEADPWTAFAQTDSPLPSSCRRSDMHRTSTSLQWKIECPNLRSLEQQGTIVFDRADHYRGTVKTMSKTGAATDDSVTVEGTRYAACTSPQD
jgi:hypothetical protein